MRHAGPCYSLLPLENSCIPALFSTATAATHLTINGYKQSFSPLLKEEVKKISEKSAKLHPPPPSTKVSSQHPPLPFFWPLFFPALFTGAALILPRERGQEK
jgi:hypothetical protein